MLLEYPTPPHYPGSSLEISDRPPLTNTRGQIADMFGPRLAGLAMTLFVAALFIGSAVGPLIRRFVAETIG